MSIGYGKERSANTELVRAVIDCYRIYLGNTAADAIKVCTLSVRIFLCKIWS